MADRLSLSGGDWQIKPYVGLDWLWRNAHRPDTRDRHGWLPAGVPGSVQHDLWQAGEIPNPYWERNSLAAEWVPQRTWVYRREFIPAAEHAGRRARLRFEGVDYEGEFYLNGERLGAHSGMFTPATFEVGDQLRYGEMNLVAVVLRPAPDEQPQVGLSRLVRTGKARMSYWWDFCPRMVHLGLWDEVQIELTDAIRIEDVWLRPAVSDDLQRAAVAVEVRCSASPAGPAVVDIALRDDEGRVVAAHRAEARLGEGETLLRAELDIPRPRLWWPNGLGDQALYQAEVRVWHAGARAAHPSDERQVTFGLRRIELQPNDTPDVTARPYTLAVNAQKMYVTGWNWVPIDALYGVPRPAKLARLLTLARRAHVNLLRVWGGGLIEREAFYATCDRLGLLVWQEFIQSSSGIENTPPDDPAFVATLAAEAEQIVALRRNHPSLALWCGGNELTTPEGRPLDEGHPLLAALRAVVQRNDPGRLWLPTSPSGPEFENSLAAIERNPLGLHDVHGPWEHQGLRAQFELYNRGASLFHSEFGVEGITNLPALNATIARDHQWPVSLANPYWFHLGAWWVKEEAWRAAWGELPDVETAVRATQFLQADGLRYAVEADRRRAWQNSGSLPWQFNEPYPMAACTSAVDYYARPKPAYYAVAGAYRPLHVSARFERQAWAGHSRFAAQAWVCSSLRDDRPAGLEIRLLGLRGQVYAAERAPVVCRANASTPLSSLECELSTLEEDVFWLDLRLAGADGTLLSQNRYVFSRTESLRPLLGVPSAAVVADADKSRDGWRVRLDNTGPWAALYVWLEDGRAPGAAGAVYLDENYFCLFPGESRVVLAEWQGVPPGERRLHVRGWNTPPLELR